MQLVNTIEVKDLCYTYEQEKFYFNFKLSQKQNLAIIGKSGAGKSTLLSLLAGFLAEQSGEILINNKSISNVKPSERPFAILFQEHNLFAHLSVQTNIALGFYNGLRLKQEQKLQLNAIAKQVGILEYLQKLPQQLSGGQKQRVALARCLLQEKPIWLLDEPFSALDPVLRIEMLELVKSIAQQKGIMVIMVTHNISDAKALATDFAFIDTGKIITLDPISNLNDTHCNKLIANFALT